MGKNKDFLMTFGKIPPQAKENEITVLGAIMLDKTGFSTACQIIKHYHFYSDVNQIIFKSFESLVRKNLPIDLLTVIEELKQSEQLDMVGGPYALTKMTNGVTSAANIEAHCRIIHEKYLFREIIRTAGEMINNAYDDSKDPFDLLNESEKSISDINSGVAETNSINLASIALKIVDDISIKMHNAINNIVDTKSVYTGISDWDKINGPLFPGGLYIVAARPAMGKGVHMTQCIVNMAKKYVVGVGNAEMTNKQLMTRVGCNLLSIDNYLWKKNPETITQDEVQQVHDAMQKTTELNWHLDDSTDVNKFCNKVHLWKTRYGVQVVLADVLSKYRPPEELIYRMTDVQKLNYVMDRLAVCAKKEDIPIIVYAHLNRELYKRTSKEPNMSDLKGSGNIEDFAFQVSLLHRPEYYDIAADDLGESTKGLMYQIVAKHREGETGRIKQHFLPQFSQLKPWEDFTIPGWHPQDSPF